MMMSTPYLILNFIEVTSEKESILTSAKLSEFHEKLENLLQRRRPEKTKTNKQTKQKKNSYFALGYHNQTTIASYKTENVIGQHRHPYVVLR